MDDDNTKDEVVWMLNPNDGMMYQKGAYYLMYDNEESNEPHTWSASKLKHFDGSQTVCEDNCQWDVIRPIGELVGTMKEPDRKIGWWKVEMRNRQYVLYWSGERWSQYPTKSKRNMIEHEIKPFNFMGE